VINNRGRFAQKKVNDQGIGEHPTVVPISMRQSNSTLNAAANPVTLVTNNLPFNESTKPVCPPFISRMWT
jgi:hypothetical protein